MSESGNVADSFEEQVANLLPELSGFFYRRIPDEADDCSAETLVAALAARKSFRGEASVRTFVFRIAHRVLGRRRRLLSQQALQHIETLESPDEVDLFSGTSEGVIDAVIANALTLMDDAARKMLELTFVAGKSRRELATHLQLSPGTVAGRLQRARTRLRSLIKDAARRRLSDDDLLSLRTREILRELAEVES